MKIRSLLAMFSTALMAGGLLSIAPAVAQETPSTTANAAQPGGIYFVDCQADPQGNGTIASPFSDLATVNGKVFIPGDRILLKKGSTCQGTLRPQGSGAPQRPIVIDSYGDSAAKPVINGGGIDATVQLFNQQYWEIRNLEITNIDSDPAKRYQNERRGVAVKVKDIGQANYYRIENLSVHDVYGQGKKDLQGSGGIQFEVYASENIEERVPTWFNDVVIANNTVENVNRSGINMSTRWKCRAEVAWDGCAGADRQNLPWTPWTAMVIRGNTVKNVGGDGIVIQMNKNALVEYNTVSDTANRANGSNAGVWAWNADGTTFQYNEVFDTKKLSDNNDGNAFDADYGTTGTVFQYNYSHDNEGGMMLFCGCSGLASDVTFRYNVSENDKRRINFVAGAADAKFYNNTIILPDAAGHILNQTTGSGTSMLMANNLIVASQAVTDQSNNHLNSVNIQWRNNAFSGPGAQWPQDPTAVKIAQKLALAAGSGSDRFKISDTALAAKGLAIAQPGTVDFFGNPVPSNCAPDIGAFQFSAINDAACSPNGKTLAAGSRLESVTVRPATTYKLSATLETGASLSVTNQRDFTTPAGKNGEVIFTTAMDATAVAIDCLGSGSCAAISLVEVRNAVVDASFDSLNNTPWSQWNTSRDEAKAVSGRFALKVTSPGSSEQFPVTVQANTDYLLSGWVSSADGSPVRLGVKNFAGNPNAQIPGQFEKFEPITSEKMSYSTVAFNSGNSKSLTIYCYKPNGSGAGYCDDITVTASVQAPTPGLNPSHTTVQAGHNAYFFAAFEGAPLTQVKWQSNKSGAWADLSTSAGAKMLRAAAQTNAIGNALTIENVTAAQNNVSYRAVLEGPAGRIYSEPATLTVSEPLTAVTVTASPADSTISEGADASFTASATGNPAPSVKWQLADDAGNWNDLPEQTSTTLVVRAAAMAASGSKYRAVFSNDLGEATSGVGTLTVQAVPETESPSPSPTSSEAATPTPTPSDSASPSPSMSASPSTEGSASASQEPSEAAPSVEPTGQNQSNATEEPVQSAQSSGSSETDELANTGASNGIVVLIAASLALFGALGITLARRHGKRH